MAVIAKQIAPRRATSPRIQCPERWRRSSTRSARTRRSYESVRVLVAKAGDALGRRRVRHEQTAEVDLAAGQRVDDEHRRVGRVDVHRNLLGRRLDLEQCTSQRLTVAEQLRAGTIRFVLTRAG